jgi:hypothetical protein
MKFMQLVDRFVGDSFRKDVDLFQKARLLVGAILSFQVFAISFAPIYVLIPNIEGLANLAYFIIAIPAVIFWAYLLRIMKAGRSYYFVAHSVIASTSAVLFAGIAVTGGPMGTEVHPILMMIGVFAFLLIGKTGGIMWSIIILLFYFALVLMNVADVPFINLPPEEVRGMLRVFNWSMAFIVVAALAMIYESINLRVIDERDAEREKFKHIATVAVDSSIVTKSADSLANTGERLLSAAIQQKTAIEQLATTTEELSATAEQNTVLANSAKIAIKDTEDHLKISKADILLLVSSMNQVRSSSEEIQMINNVINDISYQTNILSLNAMIEASRSSEASGGFKVVALEVKRLAERSAKAADNINKLLDSNFVAVKQGVNLSETMQKRFEEISARIQPLALTIQNVSDASYEQSEAIRQITMGLNDIDKAIEENKYLAEESSVTARELRNNAVSLMEVVAEMGIEL